jgi:lysophospholipase
MQLYATPGNPVPDGAVVERLVAADGVVLRAARWKASGGTPRGTVAIFPGWSEPIERYFRTVEILRAKGFAVAVLDWRGQGGSERLAADPLKGHIPTFRHYWRDIEVFRREMVLPDCPPPYCALAHSMGGNIVLSAAPQLTPWIDRLVLSAPMLGLPDLGLSPATIRRLTTVLTLLGCGRLYAPGQRRRIRRERVAADNGLTSDLARYEALREIGRTHPHLRIEAPTIGWVRAAQAAIDRMNRPGFAESLPIPVMIVNNGDDRVVSRAAIETMARRLRHPAYVLVPGARHEILAEDERYAAQFWAAFDAFVPGSEPWTDDLSR